MKTETDQPQADLQSTVKHDGDCSCWKPGCLICDCGALRATVRDNEHTGSSPIWDVWSNHLASLEQAIDNPIVDKATMRKLRIEGPEGEPIDPGDTSNWEATTGL